MWKENYGIYKTGGQVIQVMGNALKGENTGGQKVTSEVERITLCILTKKSQG